MKSFKKVIAAFLASSVVFGLASCTTEVVQETEYAEKTLIEITFEATSETTEPAPVIGIEETTPAFDRSVYTPLIDVYFDIASAGEEFNTDAYTALKLIDNGIANYEETVQSHFSAIASKGVTEVGYGYIDLTGDGIEELVVGNGMAVYAIYTFIGGAILPIAIADEYTVYYIGSDDNIYSEYDSGSYDKGAGKYYIGSTFRLFLVEDLREHSESGEGDDIKYYISNSGSIAEFIEDNEIPHENYLGPLLEYTDARTAYTMQLLSAYR